MLPSPKRGSSTHGCCSPRSHVGILAAPYRQRVINFCLELSSRRGLTDTGATSTQILLRHKRDWRRCRLLTPHKRFSCLTVGFGEPPCATSTSARCRLTRFINVVQTCHHQVEPDPRDGCSVRLSQYDDLTLTAVPNLHLNKLQDKPAKVLDPPRTPVGAVRALFK